MALSRRFGSIKPVAVSSTEEDTDDDEELRLKLLGRKDRFKYSSPAKISFGLSCRDIADSSETEDDKLIEDMDADWMEEFQCILKTCKKQKGTGQIKPLLFDKVCGQMSHAPLDTLRKSVERYTDENNEGQVVPEKATENSTNKPEQSNDQMTDSQIRQKMTYCFEETFKESGQYTEKKIKNLSKGGDDFCESDHASKEKDIKKMLVDEKDIDKLCLQTASENAVHLESSSVKDNDRAAVSNTTSLKEVSCNETRKDKEVSGIRSVVQMSSLKDSVSEKKIEVDKITEQSHRNVSSSSGEIDETKNKHSALNSKEVKKFAPKAGSNEKKVTGEANDKKSKNPNSDKRTVKADKSVNKENKRKEMNDVKSRMEGGSLAKLGTSSRLSTEVVNKDNNKTEQIKDDKKNEQISVDKKSVSAVTTKGTVSDTKLKPCSSLPPYKSEDFKKPKTFTFTPASSFPLDELLPVLKKKSVDDIDSKKASESQKKRHASNQAVKKTSDVHERSLHAHTNDNVQAQVPPGNHPNVFYGTVYDDMSNFSEQSQNKDPFSQYQDYTEASSYEAENCRMTHFVNKNLVGIMSAIQSGDPEVISTIQEALYREIGLNLQALAEKAKPQMNDARVKQDSKPVGFYKERNEVEDSYNLPDTGGDNRPAELSNESKQSEELFHLFVQQCKGLVQTEEDKAKLLSLVTLLKNESGNSLHNTGFTPPDSVNKLCTTETKTDLNSFDNDQRSPYDKTPVPNNCLFEGRTMLKGGVKPRHIPKTTTHTAGKGRPSDPRPIKDEPMLDALYLKLPPFAREMWGEQKVMKIIALGKTPTQSDSKSRRHNSYNPMKALQTSSSPETQISQVVQPNSREAQYKTVSKSQSLEKKCPSQQSRNSDEKYVKYRRNSDSEPAYSPSAKEKVNNSSVLNKSDDKASIQKSKSSGFSKTSDSQSKNVPVVKKKFSEQKRTIYLEKSLLEDSWKKQASFDEMIASDNFDKFSSKNWTPVATTSSLNNNSSSIPVMISGKTPNVSSNSKQRPNYSSKTSLIEILPVENRTNKSAELNQMVLYPQSGTNTNVIGMDLGSDTEETVRNDRKGQKDSVTSLFGNHQNIGKDKISYNADKSIRKVDKDRKSFEMQGRVIHSDVISKGSDRDASSGKNVKSRSAETHKKEKVLVSESKKTPKQISLQLSGNNRNMAGGVKCVVDKDKKARQSIEKKATETNKLVKRKERDGSPFETCKRSDRKKGDKSSRSDHSSRSYRVRHLSTSSVESSTSGTSERVSYACSPSSFSRNRHHSSVATVSSDRSDRAMSNKEQLKDRERSYEHEQRSYDSRERSCDSCERSYYSQERSYNDEEKSYDYRKRFQDGQERSDDGRKRTSEGREKLYDDQERSYDGLRRSSYSRERSVGSQERSSYSRERSVGSQERSSYSRERSVGSQERSRHNRETLPRPDIDVRERKRHRTTQESNSTDSKKRKCEKAPDEKRRYSHGDTSTNRKYVGIEGLRESPNSEYHGKITFMCERDYRMPYFEGKDSDFSRSQKQGLDRKRQGHQHQTYARFAELPYNPSSKATDLGYTEEIKHTKGKIQNQEFSLEPARKVVFRASDTMSESDTDIPKAYFENNKESVDKQTKMPATSKQDSKSLEEDRLFLECFKRRLSGDKIESQESTPSLNECTTSAAEVAREREDRLFLENCKKGICRKAEKAKVVTIKPQTAGRNSYTKAGRSETNGRGILSYQDMLNLAELEEKLI